MGQLTVYPLDGSRSCVSTARRCSRAYLEQCQQPVSSDTAGDVATVVSELVTNAVIHAPGPCCLYLIESQAELTIGVSDTSTVVPEPRSPDQDRGGGFGWHLLRRLTQRIEVCARPPWGKTVCATMRIAGAGSTAG